MDYTYCPYCGPFQRCQAAEPDECWVVTQDADDAEEGEE